MCLTFSGEGRKGRREERKEGRGKGGREKVYFLELLTHLENKSRISYI